jgi:predicted ArsR family transcriptional regulator
MDDEAPEARPHEALRSLSDPRELRALAHPVRVALHELLTLHESLTATQASKLIGGSPSSISYHLRTLAKYGYVEETDVGTGRERPWKLTHIGYRFTDETTDPDAKAAAGALSRQLFQRWLERRADYQEHKERWSDDVRDAAGDWNTLIFGTPDELRELQDAIGRLTARFRDRITHPELRPEGWETFEFQLYTHPIDIP